MQPCSVKRYLQILRFQSLLHIRLTSQEERSLGGERVECLGAKRGRKCLSGNEKQNKCQRLSKQKSQCETVSSTVITCSWGDTTGLLWGVATLGKCVRVPCPSLLTWSDCTQTGMPTLQNT